MAASHLPSQAPRLLVLWDVDHTLIETRGVGRAIYDRAFIVATGKPLVRLASISGRTELDIITETLRVNGVDPTQQVVATLASALVQGYVDAREELRTVGRALPGAHTTLARFATSPAIHQSVLTGNLRDVASVKLKVFGLDRFLDLASGAYGDDNPYRPKLVDLARCRAAERTGVTFADDRTVLIGDTPKDVEAGLVAGAHVIGVATGRTSAQELRATGAHDVAIDLDECRSLLDRLISAAQT